MRPKAIIDSGIRFALCASASFFAAAAWAESPNCGATIPALRNGGFEAPQIASGTFSVRRPSSDPSIVWGNTAEDNVEFWSTGFQSTPSFEGSQFVELNANIAGTLYQNLATIPGTQMVFSIAHKARSTNPETMQVLAGSSVNSLSSLGTFQSNIQGPDRNGWTRHSGTYTVPSGQTLTTFAFRSLGGGSSGNFLDGIEFTLVAGACDDTVSGKFGTAIDTRPLVNDIGAGLTITQVGPVAPSAAGAATIVGTTVQFVPRPWSGAAVVPYTIRDATGSLSSADIRVTINPSAVPDNYSVTPAGASLDLLANDGVTNGRIYDLPTAPSHGTANISPDGQRVVYSPASGYTGFDTFQYRIQGDPSNAISDVATVTINIKAITEV